MNTQARCAGIPRSRHRTSTIMLALILLCTSLISQGNALAQLTNDTSACGSLNNSYGPFDYTNPVHRRDKLPVVEQYHFNDEVFGLTRGLTSSDPRNDIDYTLRAFPNHHRALDAMARLHRKHGAEKLRGARYSLACYFERARRMAPGDPVVPMIEGIHLFKTERLDEAEVSFKLALQLSPGSAEIHYNLGLLYFRQGEFQSAQMHAVKAYELGFPLPGLRNQLIGVNHWPQDPTAD